MADISNTLALTVTSSRHLSQEQKVKLQKAAREFESLFVQMLLKSMRSAQDAGSESSLEGDEAGGAGDYGGDVMKSMFDTELARHIGQQGRFGIAETLYRKLTGEALTAAPGHGQQEQRVSPGAERPRSAAKAGGRRVRQSGEVQQSVQPADNTSTQARAAAKAAPAGPQLDQHGMATGMAETGRPQHVSAESGPPGAVMMAPVALAQAKADATRTQAKHAAPAPASGVLARVGAYDTIIRRAAEKAGVEPNLLKAMIVEESGGRARARSTKNAKGLMQLIDTTARAVGVTDVWDPHQNIEGGARYLKQQLERFNGNVALALASYNAGPGAVERYKGIPPFEQTRNYVKRVMKQFAALQRLESNNNDVIE